MNVEEEKEKSRLIMEIYFLTRIKQYLTRLSKQEEEEEIQEKKNKIILKIRMQRMMNAELQQLLSLQANNY